MLLHRARLLLTQEGSSVLQGLYSILGFSLGSVNEEFASFGDAHCKEQCCVCRGLGLSLHPHVAALRGAGQYLQMWIEGHNGIQQRAAEIWCTLKTFFVLYSNLSQNEGSAPFCAGFPWWQTTCALKGSSQELLWVPASSCSPQPRIPAAPWNKPGSDPSPVLPRALPYRAQEGAELAEPRGTWSNTL